VLPACLRIGRESARCLQLPEPRPPWYSSCPKRKLEGFLPISTKRRKPEAAIGNLDPRDLELNFRRHPSAWRLWAARLERRHATERASGPTTATAQPIVAEPQVPQVWFPQLKEDFLVFRGLSSESAAGCFALSSQERSTRVVCFAERSREAHTVCFLGCTLKREVRLWILSGIR
jgi:hypothetical protein